MQSHKLFCEIACPLHPTYVIQGVNLQNPDDPKLFCFTCLLEQKGSPALYNLKGFPDLIKAVSDYSIRYKNSIQPKEKPKEFVKTLSSKKEKIEKLSKHIEAEKSKVASFFDLLITEIRDILYDRKKLYLERLDQQLVSLTSNFSFFERELKKLYPSDEEVCNLFPTQESLEKRFQGIKNASELVDFVKDVGPCSLEQAKDSNLSKVFEKQRAELSKFVKELEKVHAPVFDPASWGTPKFITEIKEKVKRELDHGLRPAVQRLKYGGHFGEEDDFDDIDEIDF